MKENLTHAAFIAFYFRENIRNERVGLRKGKKLLPQVLFSEKIDMRSQVFNKYWPFFALNQSSQVNIYQIQRRLMVTFVLIKQEALPVSPSPYSAIESVSLSTPAPAPFCELSDCLPALLLSKLKLRKTLHSFSYQILGNHVSGKQ